MKIKLFPSNEALVGRIQAGGEPAAEKEILKFRQNLIELTDKIKFHPRASRMRPEEIEEAWDFLTTQAKIVGDQYMVDLIKIHKGASHAS